MKEEKGYTERVRGGLRRTLVKNLFTEREFRNRVPVEDSLRLILCLLGIKVRSTLLSIHVLPRPPPPFFSPNYPSLFTTLVT